jgi:hypothetical protein
VIPENRQIIIETLCTLLTDATDSTIRMRAAQALGRLGAETSIPLLCQILRQDSNTNVRLAIIDACIAIHQSPSTQPQSTQPMPEQSQNQPIFNIQQVGTINTGDVTISGDQIGIQNNYAPEPNIQAEQQLDQLLTKLRNQYPNETDAEIFSILITNFSKMPQTYPQDWQRWQDIFSVIFAGGVEAAKLLVPIAGIPIEILKRLYEIYDRNKKELPGA